MRPSFTYMTSSSRLLVPLLFNSCSSVMNINGRVQARPWPSALRPRTSEGKLSLDAEQAHPPSATAVPPGSSPPLPPSVVTLSDAQMAKIKGSYMTASAPAVIGRLITARSRHAG